MATPEQIQEHDSVIDRSIAVLVEQINTVTKTVERRVADLLNSMNSPEELVQRRSDLLGAFNPLDQLSNSLAEPLRAVSENSISIQNTGERDSQDTVSEQTLTEIAQRELSSSIQEQRNSVIDGLVVAAVAGTPVNELVKRARTGISGLLADTDNSEAQRLQASLVELGRSESDRAQRKKITDRLKQLLGATAKNLNIRDRAADIVEDTVMRYDSAFSISRSRRRGITKFEYVGGVIETSRPFCEDLNGTVMNEQDIVDLWNTETWAGKSGTNPWVDRGGYRCRHWWVPVEE